MIEEKDAGFFLKFPFSNLSALLKVIIIGFIPIINFISFGYVLFAARNIYEKKYELPDFDEYPLKSYFVAGFFGVVIIVVYMIIPILLRVILSFLVKNNMLTLPIVLITSLLLVIIGFIFALMQSTALLRFIKHESLSEAFSIRDVWNSGMKYGFFKKWFVATFVSLFYVIFFTIMLTIILIPITIYAGLNTSILSLLTGFTGNLLLFVLYYIILIPLLLLTHLCSMPYLMHKVYNEKRSGDHEMVNGLKKGLAITALVLSIVGIFLSILIVPTLLGLIFGIVAYVKAKRHPEVYGGKGIAIAAIIISLFGIFIMISAITTFLSLLTKGISANVSSTALKQIESSKGTKSCEDEKISFLKYSCYSRLALNTNDLSMCDKIGNEFERRDSCYKSIANNTQNLGICDQIMNVNMKTLCYGSIAIAKDDLNVCDTLKDQFDIGVCYSQVAAQKKDLLICNKLKDQMHKEFCYEEVARAKKDPNICEKIKDSAIKEACYGDIARAK